MFKQEFEVDFMFCEDRGAFTILRYNNKNGEWQHENFKSFFVEKNGGTFEFATKFFAKVTHQTQRKIVKNHGVQIRESIKNSLGGYKKVCDEMNLYEELCDHYEENPNVGQFSEENLENESVDNEFSKACKESGW